MAEPKLSLVAALVGLWLPAPASRQVQQAPQVSAVPCSRQDQMHVAKLMPEIALLQCRSIGPLQMLASSQRL
ncbi:hypothetical protein KTAU_10170 [Thermogemmatispora aurantia]|uniref:Uncharacterized protein n=1 Tax=Thermogemmatispora aurantia TaxID=2045279 RepID=A0A5J4K6T4_9CHLR|nr:hypothetical protein KTAU_10170 [Thermogemmatispora aurantia]